MMKYAYRTALLLFVLIAGARQVQAQEYYFGSPWEAKTFDGVPSTEPHAVPTLPATVIITVYAADTVAIVPPSIFGNNAVSWQQASHGVKERVRHYRNANLSVLRFPGGNLSNEYFWDASMKSDLPKDIGIMNSGDTVPAKSAQANYEYWKMTPADYYTLLDSVGAEGIISVNYSYARYGTSADPVQRAADYAAAWVRDANITRGRNIKYWEVGNENYGPWQSGYNVPGKGTITGDEYGRDFCVFANAMRAVDPSIKVGAVTVEMPVGYNNNYNQWNQRMFPHIADCADFLSVHAYFGPFQPPQVSPGPIIAAANWVDQIAPYVRNQWRSVTGKEPIPLAMTEFNMQSDYRCTANVNCTYAVGQLNSVLFALAFGKLIKNEFALATAWDLENGWAGGSDHGLLANSDEPGVRPDTPHGSFYTYYYFTRFFGDVMVASSGESSGIQAFASRFHSGEIGTVVVNPTAFDQVVKLQVRNAKVGDRYYLYEVQTNDPNSRKIYTNGQTGTQDGGGPEAYESVPAFTGTIGGDGEIVFAAPRFGSFYVVLEAQAGVVSREDDSPTADEARVAVYPNPARGAVMIDLAATEAGAVRIRLFDLTGRVVQQKDPGFVAPGAHTFNLSVEDLPAGLYLCEIRLPGGVSVTRKITVVQ